jgi:hypothetical protein
MSGGKVEDNHSHYGQGTTGNSNGETCQSTTVTLGASSNTPPFYEVIFVEAQNYSFIPKDCMVLRANDRPGLAFHTASSGRFLKGASAGGNAGATGGTSSHVHTQSHTHGINNHSHATGYTAPDTGRGEDGMSSPSTVDGPHQHAFNVTPAAQQMNSDSTPTDILSIEPYHKTVRHYIAPTSLLPKVGDIALTTEATNPIGWETCDGNDGRPNLTGFYIKNHTVPDTVAGANTHSHAHTHGHSGYGSHAHSTDQYSAYSGSGTGGNNGSGRRLSRNHRHELRNPGQTTANYSAVTTTTSTDSNEPPYILVRYVQMTMPVGGGAAVIPQIVS